MWCKFSEITILCHRHNSDNREDMRMHFLRFKKVGTLYPQPIVTGSLGSFLCIYGRWAMGHGRADKAGPSLAKDVEEASAGDGPAQSSVPTFLKRSKLQTVVNVNKIAY